LWIKSRNNIMFRLWITNILIPQKSYLPISIILSCTSIGLVSLKIKTNYSAILYYYSGSVAQSFSIQSYPIAKNGEKNALYKWEIFKTNFSQNEIGIEYLWTKLQYKHTPVFALQYIIILCLIYLFYMRDGWKGKSISFYVISLII